MSKTDSLSLGNPTHLSLSLEGAKDTFPLVVGAIPFGLTDETFAVAVNRYNKKDPIAGKQYYNLGSMVFMYLKPDNPYLIGALAACVIGGLFKNLLLTIVLSMGVFLGAQWVFAMG